MCWNGQGTTIVDSWMHGLWPMCFLGANFHTMATTKIWFFSFGVFKCKFFEKKIIKMEKISKLSKPQNWGGKEPLGHDPSKFRISDWYLTFWA